jgi:hypothetical protein
MVQQKYLQILITENGNSIIVRALNRSKRGKKVLVYDARICLALVIAQKMRKGQALPTSLNSGHETLCELRK